MKDFFKIVRFSFISKWLACGVFLSVIMITLTEASFPLIFKYILDLLQIKHEGTSSDQISKALTVIFVVFVLILFIRTLAIFSRTYFVEKWWHETRNRLAAYNFSYLQNLDLSFFEDKATGKIAEKITKGTNDLQLVLDATSTQVFPQLLYVAIATYFLFSVSAIFGFIVLAGVPLFVLITLRYSKSINVIQETKRGASENQTAVEVETISNIKTVKSYAAEKRQTDKLSKYLQLHMDLAMQRVGKKIRMDVWRFLISEVSQAVIMGTGIYWAFTGKISIGTLSLTWLFSRGAYGPLWQLTAVFDELQKNMVSVRRMLRITETKAGITDTKNAQELRNIRGTISFSGITFKYKEKTILNNFTLDVPAQKTLAIVGKSGVGKSTIIKLILRFYDPQKGEIRIDDLDIRKIKQKSLRENMGVVLQDTSLFNETVSSNILLGNPKAKMKDIIKAAKLARAHDFIVKLPEQYDTIIGERGVKLSGGEQQRVNIARAILRNPKILILDEATSHLDSENEKLIKEATKKLIEGRTSIIVAHRLSTVMDADLIVVLDKGKIVESGSHEELVKKRGIYNRLYSMQSKGYLD